MKIDKWLPLDNFETEDLNDFLVFNVNTRDFQCYLRKGNGEELDRDEIFCKNFQTIKEEEILPFIKELFLKSGGKGEWRMLSFKNIEGISNKWIKYIRFYNINKTIYVGCNNCDFFPYKQIKNTKINEDYLSLTNYNIKKKEKSNIEIKEQNNFN